MFNFQASLGFAGEIHDGRSTIDTADAVRYSSILYLLLMFAAGTLSSLMALTMYVNVNAYEHFHSPTP